MNDFFTHVASLLPAISDSPFALAGLIVLVVAATLLFYKQSKLRALAKTIDTLPEKDRLERIRLDYGVRPRQGVSAQTWLRSRRQEFLFMGFVSSLLTGLLLALVVHGSVIARPGGAHVHELRRDYAVLSSRLAAYELAARDMRNAFVLAGENAIGPDVATAAILTGVIEHYNDVYEDLRVNQELYLEPVLRWLEARPDLAGEASGVVQFALQDLHQTCLLQFNSAAFQRTMKLRTPPASTDPREAALIRAQGAIEIQDLGDKSDRLLDVLNRRLSALSSAILGTT
jgi:hypothetical protein